MKNKKAAMELTMGTMVTMVLLVGVLILGGFLVNKIFFGATESVGAIDDQVKSEISKLFSEDSSRKIIIYPQSRVVNMKKGYKGTGFGFLIRNVDTKDSVFGYTVSAKETDCEKLSLAQAESFIGLGKADDNVPIGAGEIKKDAVNIAFNIPESAPPCSVRYMITLTQDGAIYGSPVGVDVTILPN